MDKFERRKRDEEIRRLYWNDQNAKISNLAREYGLCPGRVWQIVNGYDTNAWRKGKPPIQRDNGKNRTDDPLDSDMAYYYAHDMERGTK